MELGQGRRTSAGYPTARPAIWPGRQYTNVTRRSQAAEAFRRAGFSSFGLDPLERHGVWLNDYAPELIAAEARRYPPMEVFAREFGSRTEIISVPIPLDCTDGFAEAYYGRPERLLDPPGRATLVRRGVLSMHQSSRDSKEN